MTENTYTKKERLLALSLLGAAKAGVAEYAEPQDQAVGAEAALIMAADRAKQVERSLRLAAKYAKEGADLSIVDELTYVREAIN